VALRGSSVALRVVLPPFTQLMRIALHHCRRLGAAVTAETGFCVCDSNKFSVNYTLYPCVVGRLFLNVSLHICYIVILLLCDRDLAEGPSALC